MVRGDQRVARECYTASMKQKVVDNVNVDELDMRDEVLTRPEPSEEVEPISLDDDPEHLAYIGSKLAEDLKSLLTKFLRQNRDVFAWNKADMGGIDHTVITHRLNISPFFKPVKKSGGASHQKDKKPSTRRSANSFKQERLGRWSIQSGWLTSYSSKKQMASGDSVLTSPTSTKHAQKIASLCKGSTSSWMPQPAMNFSVSWTPFQATTRSAWTQTTKKRPHSSQRKELIVIE